MRFNCQLLPDGNRFAVKEGLHIDSTTAAEMRCSVWLIDSPLLIDPQICLLSMHLMCSIEVPG